MALEMVANPETAEVVYWPPPQGDWTYDDYLRLPDNGFRYEILQGNLIMSPAPTVKHQKIIYLLLKYLGQYVDQLDQREQGEILPSPLDVNLPDINTVVQPDIVYVSNARLEIVSETAVEGSPDLIVEVLSPRTAKYDRTIKFDLYAGAGVKEYWLVDPDSCSIEVYVLRGNAYALLGQYQKEQATQSELLTGFSVTPSQICP